MGIFARGNVLWIRFRDVTGWRRASTGYRVGQEALAAEVLAEVEARLAPKVAAAAIDVTGARMPLRVFAEKWLDARDTETAKDDRGRYENHIDPVLGNVAIADITKRHVQDFVKSLAKKRKLGNLRKDGTRTETDELIAPRTVRHIYGTLRAMFADAVADDVIKESPCVLRDELPEKKDKDRSWRRTAVFTRDEVEIIISATDDKIPEDRRVLDAIMLIGAARFGEAAALTWRDYDAVCSPLGKLTIDKSYSSKSHKVKCDKTDNPREMPVHPTLAKVLAAWKLGGFERLTGRPPRPDDLIVPSRRGQARNVNHMLRRFHEDLERVGLRPRRQHDSRRTFISIARSDGAERDKLRWCTHGPSGDVFDDYTTFTWAALCDEVAKARIELHEGRLIRLPIPLAVGAEQLSTVASTVLQTVAMTGEKGGADGTRSCAQTHATARDSVSRAAGSVLSIVPASRSVTAECVADPIADELETVLTRWRATADRRALRRALLAVVADLD